MAVNVARLAGVDPESALKAESRRFRPPFRHVEDGLLLARNGVATPPACPGVAIS
jgi:hypothetical protein